MLVQAEASMRIEAVVAAAEQWQEELRRRMALKKERQRLSKCMRAVVSSLDHAVQQLDRRIEVWNLILGHGLYQYSSHV